MQRESRPSSLRTELLVSFAVLVAAAIVFAVASVVLLDDLLEPPRRALYLSCLVAGDVGVFVAFGMFVVQRSIIAPLHAAVAAAEAIADGDLRRRVPDVGPSEFRTMARSFNRMTDRLLEERAQLVRAEKLASVGRLAAGVAHEIGNPLGAIAGYLHVLRRRASDVTGALEPIEGLERESGRIDRIVRGLLDYARPRSATPTTVDVNDVVRDAVELLSTQGVLRRVDVRLELDEGNPEVLGQRHDLEQAIVNLLLNAVDAMGTLGRLTVHTERLPREALRRPGVRRALEGTPVAVEHPPATRADIWLTNSVARDVVKIVVADSGPGIPDELLERIFDPFFTTKDPGKGTGLGLAIVARVVDNLGGAIWATSAREGGAAIHMLLPEVGSGVAGTARSAHRAAAVEAP